MSRKQSKVLKVVLGAAALSAVVVGVGLLLSKKSESTAATSDALPNTVPPPPVGRPTPPSEPLAWWML